MTTPLRILLICQQDLGGRPHPVPAYRFWRTSFVNAFAEAGHELVEIPDCDWASGLLPRSSEEADVWRAQTWEVAVAFIKREHAKRPLDLVLSYLYPAQILPAAITGVRAIGLPCVNFFCDNVREFRKIPEAFRPFDLHWVPEAAALSLYRRAGLPFLHAAMPCWVSPEYRSPSPVESGPPTFVGTRDELRADVFAQAFSRGLDARLYGVGWVKSTNVPATFPDPVANLAKSEKHSVFRNQLSFVQQHGMGALARKILSRFRPEQTVSFDFSPHAGPPATDADLPRLIRESVVFLGVNRYPSPRHSSAHPQTYSRLRDLEAPMAGACYLTEWTEGLDVLYDLGTEIETWRDPSELVEKTHALVADPVRRAKMRIAGQRRALASHTIAHTIDSIRTRLNLPKAV